MISFFDIVAVVVALIATIVALFVNRRSLK